MYSGSEEAICSSLATTQARGNHNNKERCRNGDSGEDVRVSAGIVLDLSMGKPDVGSGVSAIEWNAQVHNKHL